MQPSFAALSAVVVDNAYEFTLWLMRRRETWPEGVENEPWRVGLGIWEGRFGVWLVGFTWRREIVCGGVTERDLGRCFGAGVWIRSARGYGDWAVILGRFRKVLGVLGCFVLSQLHRAHDAIAEFLDDIVVAPEVEFEELVGQNRQIPSVGSEGELGRLCRNAVEFLVFGERVQDNAVADSNGQCFFVRCKGPWGVCRVLCKRGS